MNKTTKQIRRIIVAIIGSTLLFIGMLMIVLPGPAFVIIPLALAVLATEFIWARKILRKVRESLRKKN